MADLLWAQLCRYLLQSFVLGFWQEQGNKDDSQGTHDGVEQEHPAESKFFWKLTKYIFSLPKISLGSAELMKTPWKFFTYEQLAGMWTTQPRCPASWQLSREPWPDLWLMEGKFHSEPGKGGGWQLNDIRQYHYSTYTILTSHVTGPKLNENAQTYATREPNARYRVAGDKVDTSSHL